MFYKKIWQAAIVLIGLCLTSPSQAQELSKPILVGTKSFPPFVFEEQGVYRGFSIELWEVIAAELQLDYELYGENNVSDLLEAINQGYIEIAVAGITITSEREQYLDFSHPFFESGLQIMVRVNNSVNLPTFVALIFSRSFLQTIGVIIIMVIVAAHLLWWFERHNNSEMFPQDYSSGIVEAYWWAIVTLVTVGYGDKTPLGIPGRLIASVWMLTGILLISYFTASVTSALTVEKIQTKMENPTDLLGKRVGTVRGSTAAQYLSLRPIDVQEFDLITDAYKSLESGEIEAIVYDSPVLIYYSLHEGAGKFKVVGPVFEKQSYGIALKQGSQYREAINQALLTLKETGAYNKLYEKWFGNNQ